MKDTLHSFFGAVLTGGDKAPYFFVLPLQGNMRNFFLLLFYFIFSVNFSFAQSHVVDSLKIELLKNGLKEDTNEVKILNALASEFGLRRSNDSALKYALRAEKLAEKLSYKKGLADALNGIGSIFFNKSSYAEALQYHTRSRRLREEISDKRGMADSYLNIGNVYFRQGNAPEALQNYFTSLKIREEFGNSVMTGNTYSNIGIIYSQQGNYAEALRFFQLALEIYEQPGTDKSRVAYIYNNMGNNYLFQKKYDDALKHYSTALKMNEEAGNKSGMASCYGNIGIVYGESGSYQKALGNHLLALKIRQEIGDKNGIAVSCINLGGVMTKQKEFKVARKYLLNAMEISKEIGSRGNLKDCYDALADLAEETNDYKQASAYYKLSAQIKDSLMTESNSQKMAELKTRYELDQKEKEIKLKEKELQLVNKDKEIQNVKIRNQRMTIWYLIVGFTLFVVLAYALLRFYNQKKKTAIQHQVLETEMKALRSQMNPHFTFNVLNSIQYYVCRNDIKSAELYLGKFSNLIRMILEQSREPFISLEQEITMIELYLELEEMRFEKKFTYAITIAADLDRQRVKMPSMLIQPIVENAIKHGIEFKKGDARIVVELSGTSSSILCTVSDNGIGREAAARIKEQVPVNGNVNEGQQKGSRTAHNSMGSTIIEERIKALGSLYNIKLTYNTQDLYDANGFACGTSVKIEVPVLVSKAT